MKHIFRRISDILSANINAMIDQAEDPEKMIRQIIREMEESICYARRDAGEVITSEKKLERELNFNRAEVNRWLKRAEFSVKTGDEEMARQALLRKKEHETMAEGLAGSLAVAVKTNEKLKFQIQQMCGKLEEARRKAVSLKARQRAAEARGRINSSLNDFKNAHNIQSEFSRMESKVMDMEAMAEAMDELDHEEESLARQYEIMEAEYDVEAELAALKKQFIVTDSA